MKLEELTIADLHAAFDYYAETLDELKDKKAETRELLSFAPMLIMHKIGPLALKQLQNLELLIERKIREVDIKLDFVHKVLKDKLDSLDWAPGTVDIKLDAAIKKATDEANALTAKFNK